jgi:hypothetical protein
MVWDRAKRRSSIHTGWFSLPEDPLERRRTRSISFYHVAFERVKPKVSAEHASNKRFALAIMARNQL